MANENENIQNSQVADDTLLDFYPRFSNFVALYRGITRTWIDEQGVLWAEFVDGSTQEIGPVASYYYAVQSGYTGTVEEWIALLLSVSDNAESAASSASAASQSETAASQSATSASASASTAEQWATGNTGGTPTATNNSKYYSEQAATSSQSAISSASAAATSESNAQQYASNASSSAQAAAQSAAEIANLKGVPNGLAELDSSGLVPSSQLPSYVDDVLEYQDEAHFPVTGESGKIYIDLSTNKSYRWSGSTYVAIASDLALGETSSTAYRGDRGKAAYDAAVVNVDSTPTTNSTNLITSGGVKAALPETMTGATSSAAGTSGLVPQPSAGDEGKVLKGDGTWDNVEALPVVTSSDNGKVLEVVNGEWDTGTEKANKTDTVLDTTLSRGRKSNTTVGTGSFAFGSNVTATGNLSHAEGSNTTASNLCAHVEGNYSSVVGKYAHAEGDHSSASGESSHAEGTNTIANGTYTHAEGLNASAYGSCSHAEGSASVARGYASHAEGYHTIADSSYSHVVGKYNVPDNYTNWEEWEANKQYYVGDKVKVTANYVTNGWVAKNDSNKPVFSETLDWIDLNGQAKYIEIVGNGETNLAQSNARALDWDGNEYLKGDLYVGCDSDSTNGNKVAKVSELPGVMTGATSSVNGISGLVPAPTTTDVDKFLAGDGTFKSGGKPMVILSYGNSTWAEFESAYNNNVIVYCRASSNSDPATGSQTRMAFMAYVNNATTPTEVEFQYYRSVSSHTASQQGDQVFVYKLTKTGGWTVTTREASVKVVAGSNITGTYSSGTMTISGNYSAFTGATSSAAGAAGLVPAPASGNTDKYLKSDGTWGTITTLLPASPVNDGTYILQCVVSSGTPTYSWVSLPNASGVSF